ncbi:MAG: EAL domain-containing protein, partial [Casimicrobiaceae bacterium]
MNETGPETATTATPAPPALVASTTRVSRDVAQSLLKRSLGLDAIVVGVCLLAIGALWLSVIAGARFDRDEAINNAVRHNDNLAVAFEQYTVRTIQNADAILQAVKREYARTGSRIDLEALMADLGISKETYQGVGIIDEHGDLVTTTMPASATKINFSDREHFKVHVGSDTGHAFVGKPIVSRLIGKASIPITRRLNTPDGSFAGVAVVQIAPSRFTEIYGDATFGTDDIVSLIGLDGIIRTRRIGERETSGQDIAAGPLFSELAKHPVGSYLAVTYTDGVPRLFSFRTLRDYPLVALAGKSKADAVAEVDEQQVTTYIRTAAASAFIVLIAIMLLVTLARRKHALHALAGREARLRATFNQAAVGIAYLGLDGRFLQVNQKYCAIVGYTEAELLTMRVNDVTHPDDLAATGAWVARLLNDKSGMAAYEREKHYLRKDAAEVWATVSAAAVYDASGEIEYFVAMAQDITERKRVDAALRESERFAHSTLDALAEHIAVLDGEGNILAVNRAWRDFARANGASPLADPAQVNYLDVCDHATKDGSDDAAAVAVMIRSVIDGKPAMAAFEYACDSPVERRWFSVAVSRFVDAGPVRVVVAHDDITARKGAEDKLQLQADLLGAVGQSVIATDVSGTIIYANAFAERLFGWPASDLNGRKVLNVMQTEASQTLRLEIESKLQRGEAWSGELEARRRDGTTLPVQLSISPIHDKSGGVMGSIGVSMDISERKAHERQIQYLATHDALTDLPTRTLLNDRLTQAISHAQRAGTSLGMVYVDLDKFKSVNDGYGHAVGDTLLKVIAARLRAVLRRGDTVARLGGDEFVILLTDLKAPPMDAAKVARTLLGVFARPFAVDGHDIAITASLGISLYPDDGRDLDELLNNADTAMYRAKEMGRNAYQFYASEMGSKATARVHLEFALRQALVLGQFELHYQPVLVIGTGEVVGMEALIRWQHPELGSISPVDFIPLAEETGIIIALGEWVLRTACIQNKRWHDAGMPKLRVAVNLSALQLRQPGFAELVAEVLAETGLDPRYVNLEITESMVMGKTDTVTACLNQLRALGTSLSLDDFGTGYSNLGYLTHLPLDVLKIDRSFVRDVPGHLGACSIARAIVSMGRSLGLKVIAEGVETIEQAEFLQGIWCEMAQGFL